MKKLTAIILGVCLGQQDFLAASPGHRGRLPQAVRLQKVSVRRTRDRMTRDRMTAVRTLMRARVQTRAGGNRRPPGPAAQWS